MAKTDDTTDTSATDAATTPVTAEGAVIQAETLPAGSPKDLFAALLAIAPEEAKVIARDLGSLLDLHSVASRQADSTGDYKAGDVNK